LPAVPAALVTGAKRIRSLLVAFHAANTARREFLVHRSGSAHERKQKVDFGTAWWARGEPPERVKRRFFSCNGKKMAPQCRKIGK
jgi:hypothetical protein